MSGGPLPFYPADEGRGTNDRGEVMGWLESVLVAAFGAGGLAVALPKILPLMKEWWQAAADRREIARKAAEDQRIADRKAAQDREDAIYLRGVGWADRIEEKLEACEKDHATCRTQLADLRHELGRMMGRLSAIERARAAEASDNRSGT